MGFIRVQKQRHKIESTDIYVSYDRFTTRLKIKSDDNVVYSAYLALLPFRKDNIIINKKQYTLKVFWLLLWKSSLEDSNKVVIDELLYLRRKRSIGLLIYAILITSVKIGIGLMSKT